MKRILFGAFTLACVQLIGCASLVSGVNEPVSVETTPEGGAKCSLENDKGKWFVNQTPGSVTVHRSYKPLDVKCQEVGYQSTDTKVNSKIKSIAWGEVLTGDVVDGGVDLADGAAYDYPTNIKVDMCKAV